MDYVFLALAIAGGVVLGAFVIFLAYALLVWYVEHETWRF